MNCIEAIDLMGLELEGVLPVEVRPNFDRHLEACPRCHTYLDQLTVTVRVLGHLPRPPVANPRRSELLERFRREPRRRS